MTLTPEQQAEGRRNFLRALAGTPALAALGTAAAVKGPVRGGPVRVGFIGTGSQGRQLLRNTDSAFADVRALCDINPDSLAKADAILAENGCPTARHYAEWKEMLEKEDLEGVIVAAPLWLHADITAGSLEAGQHVLCEKMMAWDVAGCQKMIDAAKKTGKVLEIGYQRFYSPLYQAAYQGIIKNGQLGEVYHSRLVWHRNGNWRRKVESPGKDYDPSRWGYPTLEDLINWRLYWRYSQGLLAELASHQVNVANWFFDAKPEAVSAVGGVHRFKDGREVHDHVYATFAYPGGRTAVFTSIESNAFDNYSEMFMGTKGTLIITAETEAMFFEEGKDRAASTAIATSAKSAGPAVDSTETKAAAAGPALQAGAPERVERRLSYRNQISRFCAAVRVGTPVECGPERAMGSAKACIIGNQAVEKKATLSV